MNVHKAGAWANIGSFFIGVAVLVLAYLTLRAQQPPHLPSKEGAVHQISSYPASMWIFLGGLILAGCLQLAAAVIQGRVSKKVEASTPPATVQDRVFLGPEVTPQFLAGFFDKYTTVQAEDMVRNYRGKWMTISGCVSNVEKRTDQIMVSIVLPGSTRFTPVVVLLHFDHHWMDRLVILRAQSPISAIGKVRRIAASTVSLEQCELT